MNWNKVALIFFRELRDQLRDRRTLFTIAILPMLLYPLMGMSFFQIIQFKKEHPTSVAILGIDNLPQGNELFVDGKFSEEFCPENEAKLLAFDTNFKLSKESFELIKSDSFNSENSPESTSPDTSVIEQELEKNGINALVYIPSSFGQQFDAWKHGKESSAPKIVVFVNSANDKSRIAHDRIAEIISRWRSRLINTNLQNLHVSKRETEPFVIGSQEVSTPSERKAALWSRILPFIVLVWALTGAFYPAIDLCAGEKERGTLETLLCSPARRSEIVCGKLLTIMTFSICTSVLNLMSMGFTGLFVLKQFEGMNGGGSMPIGPPPFSAFGWLILILIPISALFSALSLAVASFARSSKEGQYYLMPLLMVAFPLLMLPMLPAAELDLGSSLIPVTGVILLLRALIEGRFEEVFKFGAPAIGVTICCCALAIRWAINQFNSESVLFRESERIGVGRWLRNLVRDRSALPKASDAIVCGVMLLMIRFFASLMGRMPETWGALSKMTLVTMIGLIAAPTLLMAIMLTRNPRLSLSLKMPKWQAIPLAMLLAFLLHPCVIGLSQLIFALYPPTKELVAMNQSIMELVRNGSPNVLAVIGVLALAPAICEELAFRGFILSGLRSSYNKWTAIFVSSLFFAAAHSILQQSLTAFVVGILIGYIAVQSRSILPCIGYHLVHNSMTFLMEKIPQLASQFPLIKYIFSISPAGENIGYHWGASVAMGGIAIMIVYWFYRQDSNVENAAFPSVELASGSKGLQTTVS